MMNHVQVRQINNVYVRYKPDLQLNISFLGQYLLSLGQPVQSLKILSTTDSSIQDYCLPPKLPGNITESQLITVSSKGQPVVCEISEGNCWKYSLLKEKWVHFADMLSTRENAAAVNINAQ